MHSWHKLAAGFAASAAVPSAGTKLPEQHAEPCVGGASQGKGLAACLAGQRQGGESAVLHHQTLRWASLCGAAALVLLHSGKVCPTLLERDKRCSVVLHSNGLVALGSGKLETLLKSKLGRRSAFTAKPFGLHLDLQGSTKVCCMHE